MLNCLDWDNQNEFNEGVTAFQVQIESGGGLPLPLLFFDAYGLNEAQAFSPGFAKDPDIAYVAAESSVKPSVLKNVMKNKTLVVRNFKYIVNTPPLGGSLETQFDLPLNFVRTSIDGTIRRKGDIQPAFNRKNWMFQRDFLEIPGPFEIDGFTGMLFTLGAYAKVTLIWDIERID
jgi:hypothetical protein